MYSLVFFTGGRGFTLIELLVSISIIALFASILGIGLLGPQAGGADAAIVANLQNAAKEAQLFLNENRNSFTGLCTAPNGISTMMQGADDANGNSPLMVVDCNDNSNAWAIAATLRTDSGQYYCIDSVGNERVVTGLITNTAGVGNFHTTNTRVCP